MKKIIFLVVVYFSFVGMVNAQEESVAFTTKNEVGVHGGFTTGLGLSYRHWFGKTGIQVTAGGYKYRGEMASGGLSLLQVFHESKSIRFYGYIGNHYFYGHTYTEDWDYAQQKNVKNYSYTKTYNIGIGPALAFSGRVKFNLMVGYGIYDVFGDFNILPTGEIGVYYNF
jgi:hypothetical protein